MKLRKILLAATIGGVMFSAAPVLAGDASDEKVEVVQAETKKMYVTPEIGLNVRTGPGVENEKINAFVFGTVVEVVEITDNNWAKVVYDDREEGYAYMCADYLDDKMPGGVTEVIEPQYHTYETYDYVEEVDEEVYVEEDVAEDYDEPDYYVSSTGGSYYGTCRITHYCNCSQCCGQWAGGPTASGTYPTAGRTVAMDLPFGTKIKIGNDPTVYVVEDRGVSGAAVDVYCSSHSEALAGGMYYADVYIVG